MCAESATFEFGQVHAHESCLQDPCHTLGSRGAFWPHCGRTPHVVSCFRTFADVVPAPKTRVIPRKLLLHVGMQNAQFAFESLQGAILIVDSPRRAVQASGACLRGLDGLTFGGRPRRFPSPVRALGIAGDQLKEVELLARCQAYATQRTPVFPSGSAITVSDGAPVSSTTVPPAATAAAIRRSATSAATYTSTWNR